MTSCTSHRFTPDTYLGMMKGCFHHFGGLQSFERGTVRKLHAGFGGGPNLDSVRLTVEEKQYFPPALTGPNLPELVRTCPQYSDHVRTLRSHFLHFRGLLLFSLPSYPAEIAYFNSPNQELSNGVQLVQLYRNKNVDPSSSPCLKIFDGKSFERRNFLDLRPNLLKNAYFSSTNRELSNGVRLVDLR